MHKDMHYAGTYALAKLAGVNDETARKIAVSAQFVDDSGEDIAVMDEDTGYFFTSEVSTRYSDTSKYVKNRSYLRSYIDQLNIWVPFHFLPGSRGETLTQKLVCQPNSDIAQKMVAEHIKKACSMKEAEHDWGAYLVGVAAHVYADTFAHYGFSGVSSRRNLVKAASIKEHDSSDDEDNNLWEGLVESFQNKWGYKIPNIKKMIASTVGEMATMIDEGAMGHPGVGIMPDLPYLKYSFEYEYENLLHGGQPTKPRDNPTTYLECCENLHKYFSDYLEKSGEENDTVTLMKFAEVKEQISEILKYKDDNEEARLRHWQKKSKEFWEIEIPDYSGHEWTENFKKLKTRDDVLASDAYRFYMAAAWHKKVVLGDILPEYGINIECRQFRY